MRQRETTGRCEEQRATERPMIKHRSRTHSIASPLGHIVWLVHRRLTFGESHQIRSARNPTNLKNTPHFRANKNLGWRCTFREHVLDAGASEKTNEQKPFHASTLPIWFDCNCECSELTLESCMECISLQPHNQGLYCTSHIR